MIFFQFIDFLNLNKNNPANIIKFNTGNEYARNLFKNKLIKYTDIYKIIKKVCSLNLYYPLNTIKDIIVFHEKLEKRLINILKISCKLLLFLFLSFKVYSSDILIEIRGNDFTDNDVILSLIKEKPSKLDEEYSNYLIKTLDNSNLFDEVSVKIEENKFIIFISEYANLNKIYYRNNERLKKEELDDVANQLNISNSNPNLINNFITEVKKIYNSFGYNNIEITYSLDVEESSNVADLYIEFNEGEITKISNIYFEGNDIVSKQSLRSVIKSKTKTLRNIFANNNYKEFIARK